MRSGELSQAVRVGAAQPREEKVIFQNQYTSFFPYLKSFLDNRSSYHICYSLHSKLLQKNKAFLILELLPVTSGNLSGSFYNWLPGLRSLAKATKNVEEEMDF